MLDTNEFQKAKNRVLENKKLLHEPSILEAHIDDLELICINERTFELSEILGELVRKTENLANLEIQFRLLLLYFQQIYHYMQKLDRVKQIVKKMVSIAELTQNVEHITLTLYSKSIMNRIIGLIEDSNKHIHEAMETIKPEKDKYPDTYHRILYSYCIFLMDDLKQLEITENIESCVNYWFLNQNTLPMILGISVLLRSYSTLGDEHKFSKFISWIFSKEKIQDRVLDSHFTILYSFVGRIYALRSQIPEAISYLQEAYNRVKQSNSQEELMYEFVEIQKFLCRSYAFIGSYEESYEVLINFLNYLESNFVRNNYYKSRIKTQYFSAYYTLLFIFIQLDVNISSIDDEKLKRIHNYVKDLIEQSQISRDLLFDTMLDEREVNVIDKEKSLRPDELYLNLYQQLVSLETYSADEKTIDKINLIRDYVHNTLYADIVIGKIHFSMGNFQNFNILVKKLNNQISKADTPVLRLWIQFLNLLNQILENPNDSMIINEIQNLENHCKANKFFKMADEVNLYLKLLKSSSAIEEQSNKFQQTAFLDLYNHQSRKMVIDILDQKDTQNNNQKSKK